jgi:hypothetical protein
MNVIGIEFETTIKKIILQLQENRLFIKLKEEVN